MMLARKWLGMAAGLLLFSVLLAPAWAAEEREVPVKGMVTMLDLGSDRCIPCRMMAPILEKLKTKYQGRAAIVYRDVYQSQDLAQRFGIRVIPTQIFYDHTGKIVGRHEGFLAQEQIEKVLAKLGVKAP